MSGWFVSETKPVEVAAGACLCPGTPHANGDVIYLRPELDATGGMLVVAAMAGEQETLVERLGRAYLLAGIVDWTFVDDAGRAVPVTRENITRLRFTGAVLEVANVASDLYGEAVLAPLVLKATGSSPNGPSAEQTQGASTGSRRPRKQ